MRALKPEPMPSDLVSTQRRNASIHGHGDPWPLQTDLPQNAAQPKPAQLPQSQGLARVHVRFSISTFAFKSALLASGAIAELLRLIAF